MKQILILIIILMPSVNWPQIYMNINKSDGTIETFNIDDIRKLTFSGIITSEDKEKISSAVKTFVLLQNFPNPFNPSTTIEYQIPDPGEVIVSVYDVNGQLIKTLDNSFHNAGSHKLNWDSKNEDGINVASGIYLCQVIYKQTFLTKKLILIK